MLQSLHLASPDVYVLLTIPNLDHLSISIGLKTEREGENSNTEKTEPPI